MNQQCKVFGIPLLAADAAALTRTVEHLVDEPGQHIVGNVNLHALYLMRRDGTMREFLARSGVVHIDGMPVAWLARLLGHPVRREHRVTYVDWFPFLCRMAERRGFRLFYLGATQESVERGVQVLRHRYPGLQVQAHHGYLQDAAVQENVIAEINAFRPHLLMVGMSMPRQERWILDHGARLDARVFLPCGAAIDYVAGTTPTPPRWLARLGAEWLCRLVVEPRRLFTRYLIEPVFLVGPVLRELWLHRVRGTAGP